MTGDTAAGQPGEVVQRLIEFGASRYVHLRANLEDVLRETGVDRIGRQALRRWILPQAGMQVGITGADAPARTNVPVEGCFATVINRMALIVIEQWHFIYRRRAGND